MLFAAGSIPEAEIEPAFRSLSAQAVPDPTVTAVPGQHAAFNQCAQKCCLSVLQLAPVSLMASPMTDRRLRAAVLDSNSHDSHHCRKASSLM